MNTKPDWQKYSTLTITDSTSGKPKHDITVVHYRSLGKLQKELKRDSEIIIRAQIIALVYLSIVILIIVCIHIIIKLYIIYLVYNCNKVSVKSCSKLVISVTKYLVEVVDKLSTTAVVF